ncbi:MAG: energy transducer TonB, partial [Myxococcota bacterium]
GQVGGVVGGVKGGVVGGTVGGTPGGSLGAPLPDQPVRPTKDMTPARVIKKVPPVYPRIAREGRMEGRVMLMLVVDRYGRVTEARVLSGPAVFRAAAVEAVKQWVYEPARRRDGSPVPTYVPQPVEFNLH